MKLNVTWINPDAGLFSDADIVGTLTDEHAASSYGLPVVVADGKVYGPAELPEIHAQYAHLPSDLAPELYESDEHLRARRTPESIDLAERARAAGYRIA